MRHSSPSTPIPPPPPKQGVPIPDGYGGLQWSDYFYYLDGVNSYGAPWGWPNAVVSPNNVAFNGYGADVMFSSSDGQFNLDSGYFTSAWSDDNVLTIAGYYGSTRVHSMDVRLSTGQPAFVQFDWKGINSVYFSSSGGQYIMDDLSVTPVPEPTTVIAGGLLLLPLGLSALRRIRKTA